MHLSCINYFDNRNISDNENKNVLLFAPLEFTNFIMAYVKNEKIEEPEVAQQFVIYCAVFLNLCSKQQSTPKAIVFWLKQSIVEAEAVYWDKVKSSKIKKNKY